MNETNAAAAPKVPCLVTLQRWVCDYANAVCDLELDAAPALDTFSLDELPAHADDLHDKGALQFGDDVFHAIVREGLAPDWDGPFECYLTDDDAYQEYLNARRTGGQTAERPVRELKTVRELIVSADRELLRQSVERRFRNANIETVANDVTSWLERLLQSIATVPTIPTKTDDVICAYRILDQDLLEPRDLAIRVTTSLFQTEDLHAYLHDKTKHPSPYAYEFEDWADILATPVWMQRSLCAEEVADAVADAIWELTYFGDNPTTAAENADELFESIEAVRGEKTTPLDLETLRRELDIPETPEHKLECSRVLTDIFMRIAKPLSDELDDELLAVAHYVRARDEGGR